MTIEISPAILDPLKHLVECYERIVRAQLRPQYGTFAEFEDAVRNNSVLRDARESIRQLEER